MYFATSAENWCGRGHCCCGSVDTSGGVSSSHTGFCIIDAFRFADFISSSQNCYPPNHKDTRSSPIFLFHPEVLVSIRVGQSSLQ